MDKDCKLCKKEGVCFIAHMIDKLSKKLYDSNQKYLHKNKRVWDPNYLEKLHQCGFSIKEKISEVCLEFESIDENK